MNKYKTVIFLDAKESGKHTYEEDQRVGNEGVELFIDKRVNSCIDAALTSINRSRDSVQNSTVRGDDFEGVLDSAQEAHDFAVAFHQKAQEINSEKEKERFNVWFRIAAITVKLGDGTGEAYYAEDRGIRILRGDRFTILKQLQEKAQPGGFLIDEMTFQSLPLDLKERYDSSSIAIKDKHTYRKEFAAYRWSSHTKQPSASLSEYNNTLKSRKTSPQFHNFLTSRFPFLGREDELGNIHDKLVRMRQKTQQGSPIFLEITGIPGIGKTRLIEEYCRRREDDYPGGTFQISEKTLKNGENARNYINEIARIRKLYLQEDFPVDSMVSDDQGQLAYWSHQWQPEGRTLLLLENVQDFTKIENLLPRSPLFEIVITSSSRLPSLPEYLKVGKLKEEASRNLLLSRVDNSEFSKEKFYKTVREINNLLGHYPQALVVVCGCIKSYSWSPERALNEVRKYKFTNNKLKELNNFLEEKIWMRLEEKDSIQSNSCKVACMWVGLFSVEPIPWTLVNNHITPTTTWQLILSSTKSFFQSSSSTPLQKTELSKTLQEGLDFLVELNLAEESSLSRGSQKVYRVDNLIHSFFRSKLEEYGKHSLPLKKEFCSTIVNSIRKLDSGEIDKQTLLSWLLIKPHIEEIIENWTSVCSSNQLRYISYKSIRFNTFLLEEDQEWIDKADKVLTKFGVLEKSALAYFQAAVYFSENKKFDIADELFLRTLVRFTRAIHTPWRSYFLMAFSIYFIPSFFAKLSNFASLSTATDYFAAALSLPFLTIYILLITNGYGLIKRTNALEIKINNKEINRIDQLHWDTLLVSSRFLRFNLNYLYGFGNIDRSLYGQFVKPLMTCVIEHNLRRGQFLRADDISDRMLQMFLSLLDRNDPQIADLQFSIGKLYLSAYANSGSCETLDTGKVEGHKRVLEKSEELLRLALCTFQGFNKWEKAEKVQQNLAEVELRKLGTVQNEVTL